MPILPDSRLPQIAVPVFSSFGVTELIMRPVSVQIYLAGRDVQILLTITCGETEPA